MKKKLKYILVIVFVILFLWAISFFIRTNSKSLIIYDTISPTISSIEKKSVITGKLIPEDEIKIKPQISGIVDKILVKEGDKVKVGDLISVIKVVPNEQSLNQAKGRVYKLEIALKNTTLEYERNKKLFEKKVISNQDFNNFKLQYDQAVIDLKNAKIDYQIIKKGSFGKSSSANTNVRATVSGTILEIPVKKGDQVIESNNFNDGTTIASIADLNKMIFEGKIDEAEVEKLKLNMPLGINLGAVQGKKLDAKLKFISPKGIEESGTVQFKIEADVAIEEGYTVRAGYSANASFVLDKKDSILVIPERLLQFDIKTGEPYVRILSEDKSFKRVNIETGISDGINIEIISGVKEGDKIKEWNKTEPIKK